MKRCPIALFFFALAFAAPAAGADLLDDLHALRDRQSAVSMPFEHRRFSPLFKRPQTRAGRFHFDGGERIAILYTQPEIHVFLVRDGQALHLSPQNPRPAPVDIGSDPLAGGFAKIFRLDPDDLRRSFEIDSAPDPDGRHALLTLTPRRAAPIARISLRIDSRSGLLSSLRIDERSGDSQLMIFEPPDPDPPDPSLFTDEHWSRFVEGRAP